MLHPRLEVADFSRQGYGIKLPNIQPVFPTESSKLLMQEIPRLKMTYEKRPMLEIAPKESVMSATLPEKFSTLEMPPNEYPMLETPSEEFLFVKKQTAQAPALNWSKALECILSVLSELPIEFRDPVKNSTLYDTCFAELEYGFVCGIFKPGCKFIFDIFQYSHKFFCCILNVAFEKNFGGIPCNYLPPIDDLLHEDCGECMVVPSLGNLRRFIFRDINTYDQSELSPLLTNTTVCFHPNNLQTIDLSNIYPFGYSDVNLVLQSAFTGFENLKELKLSACGLIKPYYNLLASFQISQALTCHKIN